MSADTDSRGLRYTSRSFGSIVAILEKMFEPIVDKTSDNAFHDSFYDSFNAFFIALAGFLHRYHPLTRIEALGSDNDAAILAKNF